MSLLRKKGRSRLIKLPDGRKQVIDRYEVRGDASDPASLGTVFLAWGTQHPKYTDCRLIRQPDLSSSGDQQVEQELVRVYEEIPATGEVQVGKLRITTGDDGRDYVVAQFIQLSSDAYDKGDIGVDEPPGYTAGAAVLDRVSSNDDGAVRLITRYYLQASATAQQIGGVESRPAGPRAFVGTSAGAIISSTRFAREWTVRYLIKGDATASDGAWLAVSATMAFGSRTGYLTSTYAERRGIGYTIIARVYTELPDTLVYDQRQQYFFPGKLGFANAEPYVSEPGVTRETTIEVEETYHVGEVAAQALEFEVLYWAQGAIDFTVDATGEDGTQTYRFPGCIGDVTIAASNRYFNGVLCSSVAGGVASDPSAYPTGKKRISSKPYPWKGDIWMLRNLYVTFP